MSFKTIALAGNKVLVRGTDVTGTGGQEVLDSTQWLELNQKDVHGAAHAKFNEAVEAFFAPITDAIDELEAAHRIENAVDPLYYIVKGEAVEAVAGESQEIIELNRDSVILRAIEEGQSDRLVWVNNHIEVTAAPVASASAAPATQHGCLRERASSARSHVHSCLRSSKRRRSIHLPAQDQP